MEEQAVQPPPFSKVSAVIVARNCVDHLRRCLGALRQSHYRELLEILVVDAGSRDGSAQVDHEFEGVTVLRLPQNFGTTRSRNIGIRTATGELLLLLDPQVEPARDMVEKLARALESDTGTWATAPRLLSPAGEPVPNSYSLPDTQALRTACTERADLPATVATGRVEAVRPEAFLVRRSLITGMNYLDEKKFAQHWSELDIFRQIRNAGKKVVVLDETTAVVHPGGSQAEDSILEAADRVLGAQGYLAKTQGFGAALSFRIAMTLSSLGNFRLFRYLLVGQRIDGMLK
jgi:GT2 family glycosyltransferase